jgi:hypothetical protein
MNSPADFFIFCDDCTKLYSRAVFSFQQRGTAECKEHGTYDLHEDLAVTCRSCANEGRVCQKCGRPMETPM